MAHQPEDQEHVHGLEHEDALAPAIGAWYGLKLSVLFFWAPLAVAIIYFAWWRA